MQLNSQLDAMPAKQHVSFAQDLVQDIINGLIQAGSAQPSFNVLPKKVASPNKPDTSSAKSSSSARKPRPKKKVKKQVEKENPDDQLGDHATADDAAQKKEEWWKKAPVKIHIEDHFDDCGDDVSPIETTAADEKCVDPPSCFLHNHVAELTSNIDKDLPLDMHFSHHWFESTLHSSDFYMYEPCFFNHYFKGSDSVHSSTIDESSAEHFDCIFAATESYLAKEGTTEVLEIFGGKGGVLRIAVRKGLRSGGNYDLTTNINLLVPKQRAALYHLVRTVKPLCGVLAPPCTAFGSWSYINQKFESYAQARQDGEILAAFAISICFLQLQEGRHYVLENPQASRMWQLFHMARLWNHPRTVIATCDQCMYGLKDPAGMYTRKSTTFACSSELIARRLRKRCDKSHSHAQLMGSVHGQKRCAFAQVWPLPICEAIVAGIVDVKRYRSRELPYASSEPSVPEIATQSAPSRCPGCVAHAYRRDPRHNRIQGICKFSSDTSEVHSCQAWQRHLSFHHPRHSLIAGECHWFDALPRVRRPRDTHPLRPARVPEPAPAHEAKPEDDEGANPPDTSIGPWSHVTDAQSVERSLTCPASADGPSLVSSKTPS